MFFVAADCDVASAPWEPPPPPSVPQGPKRKVSRLGTQFQEAAKGAGGRGSTYREDVVWLVNSTHNDVSWKNKLNFIRFLRPPCLPGLPQRRQPLWPSG